MAIVRCAADHLFGVARSKDPVKCFQGLRLVPDHDFDTVPSMDVLVVPGGIGTRPLLEDEATLDFVRRVSGAVRWTTSVCTGALVLAKAGLLDGRRATTHWSALEALGAFDGVQVVDDERYVRDGSIVTAAGVSAGIDMALWIVGQEHGPDVARQTIRLMQYDPEPPYRVDAA